MPIPKPSSGESREDFISRCMSDETMVNEYKEDQRMAICSTSWKDSKKSVKKQSDTISLMSDFKYFVKIEKAYEEEGSWYVQGIASGTSIDLDDCKMSKSALQRFVEGLPLPLTDNHEQGEVLATLGEVVDAKLLEDDSLFIKAKLDKEHPAIPYLVKKIGQGKKYAFSIEGLLKKARTIFSDALGKFVTEYMDIEPEAISITTRPAYQPSFLEVVSKSYKKAQEDKIIKEQNMDEDKVVQPEEIVEEVVEETETAKADEVVEDSEATESKEEEKKEELKSESPEATPEAESKQEEEVVETTESAEEKEEESPEDDKMKVLSERVESLSKLVEALLPQKESVEEPQKTEPSLMEAAIEVIKQNNKVMKSLENKVARLESLPLQKKTKATLPVIEKSTTEDDSPKSIRDLVEKIV